MSFRNPEQTLDLLKRAGIDARLDETDDRINIYTDSGYLCTIIDGDEDLEAYREFARNYY